MSVCAADSGGTDGPTSGLMMCALPHLGFRMDDKGRVLDVDMFIAVFIVMQRRNDPVLHGLEHNDQAHDAGRSKSVTDEGFMDPMAQNRFSSV